MVASTIDLRRIQPAAFPDRVFLPAPWDQAEDLCVRLREHGIPATAYFELGNRTAGLELPTDVDLDVVSRILEKSPV